MKRRLLSVFLSFCMILTLLPATALAADTTGDSAGNVVRVGEQTYATLAAAITAANQSSADVEVFGEYNAGSGISSEDATAMSTAQTNIIIQSGGSLGVPFSSASGLLGYSRNIVVEVGGEFELPNSSFQLEPWFGKEDARMYIQEGSITLTGFENVDTGGVQWILSDDAEVSVPSGAKAFLQLSNSSMKTLGTTLVIPQGATFTVEGTLRGVSGSLNGSYYPSSIVVNGSFDGSSGDLALGMRPTIAVGEAGQMTVGDVFWDSACTEAYHKDNQKFDLAPGGTLTVLSDSNFTDVAESTLMLEDGETVAKETTEIGTVYSVTTESTEEPGTVEPEEPVAPQAGIVVAGADGKEISGSYTTVDEALNALNAQTNDKSGKITLLDRGEGDDTYTLTSSTLAAGQIIEVQSGATLKVNAGLTVSGTLTVNGTITTGENVIITLAEGGTMTVSTGNEVAPVAAEGFELVTDTTTTSGVTAYSVKATEPGGEGGETEEPDPEEPPVVTEPENPVSDQESFEEALTGNEETVTIVPSEESEAAPVVITISTTTNVSIGDKTIVVTNNTSLVLGDVETVQEVLSGSGSLKIETGGTLYIPASLFTTQTPMARALLNTLSVGTDPVAPLADEDTVPFIGTSDDAYIKLSDNATAEIVGNELVISGGTATVNTKLNLTNMALGIRLTGNATMNFADGASLTTDAENPITVESGSTLNVPLLSAAEAAAMASNINLEAGANVKYSAWTVLGSNSPMLALDNTSDGSTATMNVAAGTLTLNTGKATVSSNVNALLALTEQQYKTLSITTAAGTELVVGNAATLNIPNNTSLTINGTATVEGTMEIHSAATLAGTGTVNVSGTLDIKGSKSEQQAEVSVPIAITGGGKVTVAPERATGDYVTSAITGGVPVTDENGNVTYENRTGITVTKTDGTEIDAPQGGWTVANALTAQDAVHIYLNASETAYELDTSSTIGANQTLHVQSGATLKVTAANSMGILDSTGSVVVNAGGTMQLPGSGASKVNTWVGTSTDTDARLQLTSGTVTFSFSGTGKSGNVGTLTLDGEATVPSDQESLLHLNMQPVNAEITVGSKLTVADEGTLRLISGSVQDGQGSKLTVNGTLDVQGLLELGQKASLDVGAGGTLKLPVLSKTEMSGTSNTSADGIKGDIIINGGSTVTYAGQSILGGTGAYLTMDTGKATLNVSGANETNGTVSLTLNEGTAAVNNKNLRAFIVDDGGSVIPMNVTIAGGATANVPKETKLTIVNGGSLTVKGSLNVSGGILRLNSKSTLTGNVSVTNGGIVTLHSGDAGAKTTLNDSKINLASGGIVYSQFEADNSITGTAVEKEAEGSYTVDGMDGITFAYRYASTEPVTPPDPEPETYTITFNANGGSVDPTTKETDTNGRLASLPTPTRSGSYCFDGWFTTASGGTQITTATVFTQDTTVYAHWTYTGGGSSGGGGGGGGGGSSSSGYIITVEDTDHGSIRVSPSRASKGDTVTITIDPDTGYELGTLTVIDKNGDKISVTDKGNDKYTFTMPSGKVTVEATFVEITEEPVPSGLPFTDVHTGDWFYDAVEYAYENGMMDGIGNNLFSPNGTTTRAMIVTILHRLENQPASGTSIFTDVPAGQWYTNAVAWAAANGIVDGYGDGRFGPNDTITREQMAAILYRYAQFKGYDVSNTGNLSGYTDAAQVSEWARTAMGWANAQGLITGNTATTLNPTGSATRAEVATILMRFVENVAK